MSFFRKLFLFLLIVNAAFLGYDHFYRKGHIAADLVEKARNLDAATVQAHLRYAWSEVNSPEKLAGHVNRAFAQLKEINTPGDLLQLVRDRVFHGHGGAKRKAGLVYEGNVAVLTSNNFDTIMDGSKPALVEFYAPWCGHCKKLAPTYEELGDAFANNRDQVLIAKVNADEHRDLGQRFGIQGFPTIKWFPQGVTGPDGVEDYRGGRDLDSLTKFVREKSGVRPRIKSHKSDVVVLTSKNFDSVVKDPSKNVLVEFYAPWCGHCKNLAPTYEKVGTAFANEPNCVVAKIDADSERDIGNEYDISGFPTIKFFPAGENKEPVMYDGPRTEAGFINFLNEKCGTHRLVGGGLDSAAGRIAELDVLSIKFASTSDKSAREEIHKEALALSEKLNTRYAKYYAKIMEKVLSEGDDFIKTEATRLDKIAKSNTVTSAKADDFTIRHNILAAFDKKAKPVEAATKDEL